MFTTSSGFYKANAGDKQKFTCRLYETVRLEEGGGVVFSWNSGTLTISVTGANFLVEGFQAGDEIQIIEYNANGTVSHTHTANIVICESNFIIIDTG